MKLAVLGAGAWGTALAIRFAGQHQVALWCRDQQQASDMQAARANIRYLADSPFPDSLSVHADLAVAIAGAELILLVTPLSGLRPTLKALTAAGSRAPVLWACKGLEAGTMKFPHQVAEEEMPADVPRGMLSGPSFAQEVARGLPSAVTIAASDGEFAQRTANALNTSVLRLYASDDLVGVEIGAAVKKRIGHRRRHLRRDELRFECPCRFADAWSGRNGALWRGARRPAGNLYGPGRHRRFAADSHR